MTGVVLDTTQHVESALAKVAANPAAPIAKAALCWTGGLDSAICAALLREHYHAAEIVAITVDVGQGEDELLRARERAETLGLDLRFLDARAEFTEWLAKAIRANVDYDGYPCATSMTRQLIGATAAKYAAQLGCDAIVDGSSGKGNDQYRAQNTFKLFAPDLRILIPVRDLNLTRLEEMALCEHYGIPIQEVILGGEDKTMWCRSIASGGITLDTELPDDIWLWYTPPYHAPDVATTLSLTFEAGVPTAINGQRMPLAELVPILNDVGGANGLGRIDIIEDGIMDLKSREIYEAPAAAIILALHRDLEQLTLTRDEIQFKKMVDAQWSSLVFGAEWFTPLKADLDAFIVQSQGPVNGTYEIELYKGTMTILSRRSPSSLYFEEVRSIQSASFDQRWCGPAAQVRALPFELLAKRDARWKAARGGASTAGEG